MRFAVVPLLVFSLTACASSPPPSPVTPAAGTPKKFAMRTYYMAFLRRGPRWIASDTPERKALFAGHMANIQRLAADGKLVLAGPFDLPDTAGRDAIVGIFIFDVPTQAEAEALVTTDPSIAAGHFAAEVLPWYGPSGLSYDGKDEELARLRAAQH